VSAFPVRQLRLVIFLSIHFLREDIEVLLPAFLSRSCFHLVVAIALACQLSFFKDLPYRISEIFLSGLSMTFFDAMLDTGFG
jgi:hypothetical protein